MHSGSLITTNELVASRIVLRGLVQGVGMRPAIVRLAQEMQLAGFVINDGRGVTIHIEGTRNQLATFERQLNSHIPAEASVSSILSSQIAADGLSTFAINSSDAVERKLTTAVPQDKAVCEICLRDVQQPDGRRFAYPLTTCADCGPRYSIVDSMPFDRSTTAMHEFSLCVGCQREYCESSDRRFHAQTIACPACGPHVTFTYGENTKASSGNEAVLRAASAICDGEIVAVKGVGGYQLVCDATSAAAVDRLRRRKRRPRKPLAVMVLSLEQAEQLAEICEAERAALVNPANPIVLVKARADSSLAPQIHPGMKTVGLMLPTTPLHWQLMNLTGVPCVVTSGNVNGQPLIYRNTVAAFELSHIADGWLHHNRPILRPIDDSVVRCIDGKQSTIRAGRGLAPLTLTLPPAIPILAVGANQKVALALCNGHQAVLGPHIGDPNSVAARERFVGSVEQLTKLYHAQPVAIAHDSHSDFFTTRWAKDQGIPTVNVQHHHAHVVAGMVEHGWLDREVLGVAFDGTGFGPDNTIWGGEFLLCTATDYQRVARLRPFELLGGELAIEEPWRITLALIAEACGVDHASRLLSWCNKMPTFQVLIQNVARREQDRSSPPLASLFPFTSSMGRLFDGIASLLLKVPDSTYEGEAAMRLEASCDPAAHGEYVIAVNENDERLIELDWRPMIRSIVLDVQDGVPTSSIATRFIRGIANCVAAVCRRFDQHPAVLTGGCFQNRLLTEFTAMALREHAQPIGLPGKIPVNDGGLAVGQLAVAAARVQQSTIQTAITSEGNP
ncbi:carbamoyltransferase HypF [Fuerstiella marisgermanici]|uniref:Carbamoyltransferase n=1 Tax=Fuerstiella marisgermanici TaxID=1891926 RepID=A0A1P8WCE6_9PLAN|nr:carbamoyltransferase HypF [Fuerstiella marisgermanici]APZ91728.1 Carbamoyltransferase HypF [Fuerstiella marisgermanici]